MDIISFNEASTANGRIESFIENPDSTSGVLTVPKVIAAGETITIPAGRVAILPDLQVDGNLVVDGDLFIPTGSMTSKVVQKVASTDNAIVRFDGATGQVQNSGVIIDDSDNVGIGTNGYTGYGKLGLVGQIGINCSGMDAVSARGLQFFIDGNKHGNLSVDNYDNLLYIGNGIGYGTGAGGTVTQLTNKSTTVTLNKPSGQIIMNNAALAAGASVMFQVNCSVCSHYDVPIATGAWTVVTPENYRIEATKISYPGGTFFIKVTNVSGTSLSEALTINFAIIKGANS